MFAIIRLSVNGMSAYVPTPDGRPARELDVSDCRSLSEAIDRLYLQGMYALVFDQMLHMSFWVAQRDAEGEYILSRFDGSGFWGHGGRPRWAPVIAEFKKRYLEPAVAA